ncbi:MAG: lipopolysaccharide biosynthesis protein [Planctomycetes bacterium]|nr:lipopolysaccharide biosynthesis protein [Planctomycetota bacterium]
MPLGHSIRINTAWLLGGNLIIRVIQFLVGVVLARILAPEDFGLLVTLQILTGTLGFVAGGGMGEALVQAKFLEKNDFNIVFTAQLVICSLIYIILFFISPYVAEWFSEPRYTNLLRVSALTFLLRPFLNIPRAMLRRNMQFKKITVIKTLSMVFGTSSSIILALYDFGTWSLIFGSLIGTSITLAFLIQTTKWVPLIAFNKNSIHKLGGYGIRVSTNEIILHLRTQVPNLIISRMLGAHQVGLFNKADSTSALPVTTISGAAYQTIFRALSTIQTDLNQSKYIYFRTITLVTVYTFPFYIGLFWTAEPLIVFLYGEQWQPSALPLQILTIAGMLRCLTNPSGAVIAAQNRLGMEIKLQLEILFLFIVASFVGIQWGIVGVAAALLPCYLYFTLRMIILANDCINGHYSNLIKALTPAFTLNTSLFIILLVVDTALPNAFSISHPGFYILLLSLVGSISYSTFFFLLPIYALDTEKKRWIKQLKSIM